MSSQRSRRTAFLVLVGLAVAIGVVVWWSHHAKRKELQNLRWSYRIERGTAEYWRDHPNEDPRSGLWYSKYMQKVADIGSRIQGLGGDPDEEDRIWERSVLLAAQAEEAQSRLNRILNERESIERRLRAAPTDPERQDLQRQLVGVEATRVRLVTEHDELEQSLSALMPDHR